ncbi:hypothetical protein IW248_003142 [Micromonospora ureilytica]|uniref:Uncharacterized protein n=1 Tax=Micromonospora ureilytica TaxID=709868 RepID=A0ABS0JJE1_9ACTN|nr:hypothetical protein [Micromonospora ureilytica]
MPADDRRRPRASVCRVLRVTTLSCRVLPFRRIGQMATLAWMLRYETVTPVFRIRC